MKGILGVIVLGVLAASPALSSLPLNAMENEIILPSPQLKGKISLEQAINERRSQRSFRPQELTQEQISQLLWSAQGITDSRRMLRSAPSAGALYPMEIYLLTKDGLFRYLPDGHKLKQLLPQDLRQELVSACWGQGFVAQAPVDIAIAAVYERVTSRYGQRGRRYTDIEVGHLAQNIHLQAVALGLSSVPVGAFDDRAVKKLLQLSPEEEPLYIIPVGYIK